MSQATQALLAPMGFNRNTSRQMIYGSRRHGVIGLTHGYAKQGADSVCHLLTHLRWGGKLGTLMLCVLSQLQLLSGRGVGLLEIPKPLPTKIPNKKHHIYYWNHLEIGWFTSIRSFLYSIQATITIRDLWVPRKGEDTRP